MANDGSSVYRLPTSLEPYAISLPEPRCASPLATRLAADENPRFFRGMVKSKPGDISIVDKPGTLLMWYDTQPFARLTNQREANKIGIACRRAPPESMPPTTCAATIPGACYNGKKIFDGKIVFGTCSKNVF